MKQVMKSKANPINTGGSNWMWGLAGYYSVARAVHRSVINRRLANAGRKSWVWSGAGYKNVTRAGGS